MAKNRQTPKQFFDPDVITNSVINFACSVITCERTDGKPDNIPPGWVVGQLIRNGKVGYRHAGDPSEGFYLINEAAQLARYGEPMAVFARTGATDNAAVYMPTDWDGVRAGTVSILAANATETPPLFLIQRYAAIIAALDMAMYTNTLASTRTQVLGVPRRQGAILESIFDDVMKGLPSAVDQDMAAQITRIDISAQFTGNDYQALRKSLYADLLKHFGAITPSMFKAERTQSAEINASVSESIDDVYIMIDQFNKDAVQGDVPYRLTYTGYGARYDNDETPGRDLSDRPAESIDPGAVEAEGGTPNE